MKESQEMQVQFLVGKIPWSRVGKIPWRKEILPTPVFLPGKSPWTEELSELQSIQLQTAGHDQSNSAQTMQSTEPGILEREGVRRGSEAITKGQEKTFGRNGHVHSLDCGGGFTNVDNQNLNCTL